MTARGLRSGFVVALAACLALGAASLLIPSAPTTDPWGWLVWGRELLGLELDTSGPGAPSWKPLPVLVAAPLTLAGDAAPELWLALSRAAGLVGVVLAYVVGRRLGGGVAGVVAALALVVSEGWLRAQLHGYSEPAVAALLLGTVELHLRGHRRAALACLAFAALARPEVWPALLVYAAWRWRAEAPERGLAAALCALVPALWMGGDLWGSGDPFHGGESAGAMTAGHSVWEILARAFGGPMLLVVGLALAALLLRPRAPLAGPLAAAAGSWTVLVTLASLTGVYPTSSRFYVPAVVACCLLAGAGAARVLAEARAPRWARPAVAAGLLAVAGALFVPWLGSSGTVVEAAESRVSLQAGLHAFVRETGPRRLLACGAPILPQRLDWLGSALAWQLGTTIRQVRREAAWRATDGRTRATTVLLMDRPLELTAPPDRRPRVRLLARSHGWRAYRLKPAQRATSGHSPRCRGGER